MRDGEITIKVIKSMEIEYYVKHVYGKYLMYVLNEDLRAVISSLTGAATLSDAQIDAFTKLGLGFKEVFPPRKASKLEPIE